MLAADPGKEMLGSCLTVCVTELSKELCRGAEQMQNTAGSSMASFYVGHSLCTVMDLSLPKASL